MKNTSEKSIIWILFWLFVLTVGDPDILDLIPALVQALIDYL